MKRFAIKILKLLEKVEFFRFIFQIIRESDREILPDNRFLAFLPNDNYLLGVYNYLSHPTWRQMINSDFEPAETRAIKNLLPRIDTFIDIGAHIGIYTCLVTTQPRIKVFAFEPNKENFRCLKKNVEINKITKKVTVFNIALGSSRKKNIPFYGKDAGGSIVPETYKDLPSGNVSVEMDKLDNYLTFFKKKSHIFVKIDVEGAEFQILKGAQKFFRDFAPDYLLIEIVKYWGGGENPNFSKTFKFLNNLGYIAVNLTSESDGGNYLFTKKQHVRS